MDTLLLTHCYPQNPEGAEGGFVHQRALQLKAQGYNVRVVAPDDGDRRSTKIIERRDDIPVYFFKYSGKKFGWRFFLSFWWVAFLVRWQCEKPEIESHWLLPAGLIGTMLFVPRIRRNVVIHRGEFDLVDPELSKYPRFFRMLGRWVFQQTGWVQYVSQYLMQRAWEDFEISACQVRKYKVSPMPINIELFYKDKRANRNKKRRKIPVLVCVSRLVPYKHVDQFVRVCADILKEYPKSLRVFVIGTGPEGKKISRMMLGAGDFNLLPEVPPDHIGRIFREDANLVVSCAEGEGYGMTLAEARACGTETLALDSGAHRESGKGGLFFWSREGLKLHIMEFCKIGEKFDG